MQKNKTLMKMKLICVLKQKLQNETFVQPYRHQWVKLYYVTHFTFCEGYVKLRNVCISLIFTN